ncbi:MAG: ATPase [Rhodospirillaceae bacterium]|nr:MAG: ATPase [Rhodospirillaceae bacterium]
MAIYALWNNKGGVRKSYLTFQIACEYARTHPQYKVLVLDMCPQANASSMLLGGVEKGERNLEEIMGSYPRKTIAGYINGRVLSPYVNPCIGAEYVLQIQPYNDAIPENIFLVSGDEDLEIQASRVAKACSPGPDDAWRIVHGWISDLIADIRRSWNIEDTTVFIDCNPSFTIYTELAMSASDRLIIPFSADGSSKRAVRAVLSLLYGRGNLLLCWQPSDTNEQLLRNRLQNGRCGNRPGNMGSMGRQFRTFLYSSFGTGRGTGASVASN